MSSRTPTPMPARTRETLEELNESWARAVPKQDWDAILDLCTDDVAFLPPDEPVVEGKEAQRKWHEDFPRVQEMTSTLVDAETSGDLAFGRGVFSLVAEPEAGTLMNMKGKWLAGYRRQPDGSWLIAQLAWNLDEPAG